MILLQAESFEDEDISLRSDVGEIAYEYRRVFRNDDCPFPELLAWSVGRSELKDSLGRRRNLKRVS